MPPVASHRFDAGAVALAVHDWGGAGRPILLAHATGFHGLVWEPLARMLVAGGHRVLSFDFRGHGDSDAPTVDDAAYSWHRYADDVLAVAAHLELAHDASLVACGHSKGAAALLLGEAREPGTFPRIWAYEPIIFAAEVALPPQPDFPLARGARKRRNEWTSRDEAFASYASKPPLDVMTAESLRAYVDYGLRDRGDGVLELKCRPDVEAATYAMGPNHGAYALLPGITAKVVVACGSESVDIGPERAAKLAGRLANGRLEVMTGLGHFGPQQDPAACAASILRFASE